MFEFVCRFRARRARIISFSVPFLQRLASSSTGCMQNTQRKGDIHGVVPMSESTTGYTTSYVSRYAGRRRTAGASGRRTQRSPSASTGHDASYGIFLLVSLPIFHQPSRTPTPPLFFRFSFRLSVSSVAFSCPYFLYQRRHSSSFFLHQSGSRLLLFSSLPFRAVY